MKGDGNYSSDSDSDSYSSADSESSSSSLSSRCSKRKRKLRRRDTGHTCNKKKFKHTLKSKTDNNRNVKFKKSVSSREDTTKEKKRKRTRRSSVKSKCESCYSEDEERVYKKKKMEKEKRQKNKLRKQNKGEIKQQKKACNVEVVHENVFVAGKTYDENTTFQALADVKEQQKAIIQHNAELAKARLASGELQRARNEQIKMQDLYGVIDWRAKKKLRKEKRILERTVATGKKLASLDERETARMDAFRIAVGLPTAEAQRQAEWRAHATESLAELSKGQALVKSASRHSKVIGPCLPRS